MKYLGMWVIIQCILLVCLNLLNQSFSFGILLGKNIADAQIS